MGNAFVVLAIIAALALSGCEQSGDAGTCLRKINGERVAATPMYDADGIRYWAAHDANGIEFRIDDANSDQWQCSVKAKTLASQEQR